MLRTFEASRSTGLVMTRHNLAVFLDGLQVLHDEARHLEAIADRVAWNERAQKDAMRGKRAALERGLATGAVSILPIAPRRTAVRGGDGEGGAA